MKAAVIAMNLYLGTRFIGGSVETRTDLETLEKKNASIRAEDPTLILSHPMHIVCNILTEISLPPNNNNKQS